MANNIFQINDVFFTVPPTNISVHKEGLNYSVKSLRTKSSVKVASGNGIYHAQVTIVVPPKDLLRLHRIICQIKNNPFVYINNAFLKDSLDAEEEGSGRNFSLFFTAMGLNINNHPSSPGSFIVELDLRYFNNKPYIENLRFKNDGKLGSFGIKQSQNPLDRAAVSNPKKSKLYVKYCNMLQAIELYKCFFGQEEEPRIREIKSVFRRFSNNIDVYISGDNALTDSTATDVIKDMYKSAKYTKIKYRNFVNLKLDPELSKYLQKAKSEEVDFFSNPRKYLEKQKIEIEKRAEKIVPLKLLERQALFKNKSFTTREIKSLSTIQPSENDVLSTDFFPYGDLKIITVENGIVTFEATIKESKGKRSALFAIRHSIVSLDDNEGTITLYREDRRRKRMEEIKYRFKRNDVEFLDDIDRDIDGNLSAKSGTLLTIPDVNETIEIEIPLALLPELPIYKEIKQKADEAAREVNNKTTLLKEYLAIESFLSNYQPYLDRKYVDNAMFEAVSSVNFLDFKNYELPLLSGAEIDEEPELEIQFDENTVITGVNGSLRHITPSIPILGQETPTHQFLGSMEPNYQISLIGVGSLNNRMPDSFRNLEKARRDSQANVKLFSEIPDASNFAIDSMITRLLGSYQVYRYNPNKPVVYGKSSINYHKEDYNFSVNSVSTFTVEGQPNTYGLNMHFQETRSYKEEQIRNAFTNYDFDRGLSKEFMDVVLHGEKPKQPKAKSVEKVPAKPKASAPTTTTASNDKYGWMNWDTKYISAAKWYEIPRGYQAANPTSIRAVTVPVDDEMDTVKRFFIDSPSAVGTQWHEVKTYFFETNPDGTPKYDRNGNKIRDHYFKHEPSKDVEKAVIEYLNPDKCAYEIAKIACTITDYFKVIFDENIKLKLYSTLRINSDINYNARRGNHKFGGALDLKWLGGVNHTEAHIYIYFMQMLGYIKDPIGSRKNKFFLGQGFYGENKYDAERGSHLYKNKMIPGRNSVHIDLNAIVRKFVIEENGEQYVFHVPASWNPDWRKWNLASYHNGRAFPDFLNGISTESDLPGKEARFAQLLPDFSKNGITLQSMLQKLKDAHAVLTAQKTTSNTLIDIAKSIQDSPITDESLTLPEECGAFVRFVTRSSEIKDFFLQDIEKEETDTTWHPASIVKLLACMSLSKRLIDKGFYGADDTALRFKTKNGIKATSHVADLIDAALIRSDNLAFNLIVAATGDNILDYGISIRRPIGSASSWEEYTRNKNSWRAMYSKDIEVVYDPDEVEEIKVLSFTQPEAIQGQGNFSGTTKAYTELLHDFFTNYLGSTKGVDERWLDSEGNALEPDSGFYDVIAEALKNSEGKSHQDIIENKVFAGLSEEYEVYYKSGTYMKEGVTKTADLIYGKHLNNGVDVYITVWGGGSDASPNRSHMYNTEDGIYGIYNLLNYCIKNSGMFIGS